MPRIEYIPKTFSPSHMAIIDQANLIVKEYQAQGFTLTLRQLYYQFVSRDLLKNEQKAYKRLGSIINDARLAGLIDWDAMEDRTRNVRALPHWDTPADIVKACAYQYNVDLWEGQSTRCEVWIEKDALVGVIEGVCERNDVPYFSCRGNTSQSEAWGAGQRIIKAHKAHKALKQFVILHLGDHDPSGCDMTRDNDDRLTLFCEHHGVPAPIVKRLALNMDQIKLYNPPPNPVKFTDSRAAGYVEQHGESSWELDALEPKVIDSLIEGNIKALRNGLLWKAAIAKRDEGRRMLTTVANTMADES